MEDLYKYERVLYEQGIKYIGGVDEVGRGPLIGPVVSACVILPQHFSLEGLTDSKKISSFKREEFYQIIKKEALAIGIGFVDAKIIDEINILEASKKSMEIAIKNLHHPIEHVLIDALTLDLDVPSTSIIKGDSKSISIAAASVIAKVTRDNYMIELGKKYPLYGFQYHKGYPTKRHLEAIEKYGLIEEYRLTYKPIQKVMRKKVRS
ncbi:MAG: ribonuclease HII [Bacilli bacterium]|jgi:ribonuclease HII